VREWEKLHSIINGPRLNFHSTVADAVKDKTVTAKLEFFSFVASIMEPMLGKYQRRDPLVPFLYNDMVPLFQTLLLTIIKPCFVEDVAKKGLGHVSTLNLSNEKIHKRSVDIGCSAENVLTILKRQGYIDEASAYVFRKQCREFVIALIRKLKERMIHGTDFLKRVSALNPKNFEKLGKKKLLERFKKLAYTLTMRSIITAQIGDQSVIQFREVLELPQNALKFKMFEDDHRLDHFFFKSLDVSKHAELSTIIKAIMVMFHWQAEIERGFKTNKDMLQDNMKEMTLVSRRRIKDHLVANQLYAYEVELTPELLQSVRSSSA
jgi:ribosomal protein S8